MMSLNEDLSSIFEDKTKEDVIKEITQIRKNIKQKHRSMKREMLDSEEMWEKQLKPIAEPLKKIVEEGERQQHQQQQQQQQQQSDEEIEVLDESINMRKRKPDRNEFNETPVKRYLTSPPQGKKRKNMADQSTPLPVSKRLAIPGHNMEQEEEIDNAMESSEIIEEPEDISMEETVYESPQVVTGREFLKTPQGKNYAQEYILKEFKGNLAKEYFLKLVRGRKEMDHNFGVRVEGNQWMIGAKPLEIDNNDFIIDGKRYEGTRGLYELLFMNIPSPYVYSEEDLDSYALILNATNAHRVNYSSKGRIKANRGNKYKNIISQIVERESQSNPMETYSDLVNQTVTGSGIVLTDVKPNFVYYDDPNELVDRLRILKASEEAGNTGHNNEINSILEELQELDNNIRATTGKGVVD